MTPHLLIKQLRELREAAGLTRRDVGELIGQSEYTIKDWESGHHMPTVITLQAYAAVFRKVLVLADVPAPAPPPVPDGYKRCPRCEDVKPLEEFIRDKRQRSGRGSRCKPCDSEYHLDRYHARKGVGVA